MIHRLKFKLSPDPQTDFFWKWLLLSLFFHILTSFFSVGYQAVDEHFQILEFLSYKMGGTPAYDLPVEFGEKMRPWLQVAIYYQIIGGAKFLGITNPHTWAVLIREMTGLMGWLSLVGLSQCSLIWFKKLQTQRLAIVLLSTLWYFPAMHARPSSEGLGGTAFVLGITLLYLALSIKPATEEPIRKFCGLIPLQSPWAWILGGAFLGLSFEARFQMALMILGGGLWFLVYSNLSWKKYLLIFFGFSGTFILGRLADYWGYGDWSFSPWRYFNYNILRGEVSRYGQSPWWDIFRMSITESWPVLGILLATLSVVGWLRFPKHLLTWCQVPFFIVHCLIAHKEYRFFFPIGNAAPILALLSLTSKKTGSLLEISAFHSLFQIPSKWINNLLSKFMAGFLILNNSVGLLALSIIPMARNIQFQEAISKRIIPGQKFSIYSAGRDPFVISGNPTYFFRPQELDFHPVKNLGDLADFPPPMQTYWVFDDSFDLSAPLKQKLPHCHKSFSTLPSWVLYLNWNQWVSRSNAWSLYECRLSRNDN